jgi:hypothetical protein
MDTECLNNYKYSFKCKLANLSDLYANALYSGSTNVDKRLKQLISASIWLEILYTVIEDDECITDSQIDKLIEKLKGLLKNECTGC